MNPSISLALIGRNAETQVLRSLLDTAGSGQGQIALISGEAGIGKTRLITATKVMATQLGFSICQGNCYKPDPTIPYAPLLDLLHTFVTSRSEDEVSRLLDPWVPLLVLLLPELGVMMPQRASLPLTIPEQEKNHFFYAIEQFLIHLAASSPLLLVVEDIHWSDDTSLDFLLRLARRLDTQPILLVLTFRSEEEHDLLTHFLVGLGRGQIVRHIALVPLTRDETGTLLRTMFAMKQSITAEFLDAIYGLTEGNPFFIEEVVKSLLAQGDIYYQRTGWDRRPMSQLRIPRSLQVAVTQQVDLLSPDARRILTLAAAVGRRFDFALLEALSGMNEEPLFAHIRELLTAQLLVEETAEQYAFRHALTCEAVYGALLARERRAYHRLIAETTERLYSTALDSHLADLAYHYFEAGEWKEAYEYGQRAGQRAQRLDAARAAGELFTRALDAAQRLDMQPPPELYRARGQAFETVGKFDIARANYEQALQIARETGDARSQWQALLDLGFLWAATDYATTGEYLRQALDLARVLDDPRLMAQSLNRVGNWYMNTERLIEGKKHHLEALALYEQLNDQSGLAETLDLLGLATAMIGQMIESQAHYTRAVALMWALNDRRGLSSSLAMLSACGATCFLETSAAAALPLPECLPLGIQALDLAREIEWRSGEICGLIVCGACRGAMGQYGEALSELRQALISAEEIEHRGWTIFALTALGCVYRDLFALAEAGQCLERALVLSKAINSPYWCRLSASFLASVYLHDHRLERAAEALDSAPDPDAPWNTRAQITVWAARAELALAEGKNERSLEIAEQLMHVVILGSASTREAWSGAPRLQMWYGEALAACGRFAEAEVTLAAAVRMVQAHSAPPLEWRIHQALSRVYRSQRRFEAAENEVIAAQTIIETLAANVPDDELRLNFLRQATANLAFRPASARRAAKRAFGGLTAREQQVAALVGQGKSSSEIAAALVLSERTVEKHIGNILNKLGFDRRAQIITWIAEKGLPRDQNPLSP